MADSDTQIANRALQILGSSGRISSLDQLSQPNARSMNAAYAPVRDALLRSYRWNFAIKRGSVAADSTETTYEELTRFLKPSDFLALIRRKNTSSRAERTDIQIEGDYLVTSESAPLEFRYIRRVEDPKQFDALFSEALAANLAMATCLEVTGSVKKLGEAQRQFNWALSQARQANAIENDSEEAPVDEWIEAAL